MAKPCRVIVPPYWTSVTAVNFSFTPFADGGSGIRLYEWGLGSSAGSANVVAFEAYNGSAVVRPCCHSHAGTLAMAYFTLSRRSENFTCCIPTYACGRASARVTSSSWAVAERPSRGCQCHATA